VLKGIGESLIERLLQIHEAPDRVVFSQLGFALARQPDVDQLDREAAVTQMEAKIVTYSDRVHSHDRETRTVLVEEVDNLSASVFAAPRAHPDDSTAIVRTLAHICHRFRLASSDVYAGDQRTSTAIAYRALKRISLCAFEPDHF